MNLLFININNYFKFKQYIIKYNKKYNKIYMSKIAICYSGILRGDYIMCFNTFKKHVLNIFENNGYKFDIYIHVWNYIEEGEQYSGTYKKQNSISLENKLSIFNPKDYLIEDFKLFKIPEEMIGLYTRTDSDINHIWAGEEWHRNVSERYSIYKANELKNKYNNINYKYVLRNRFDNFFDNDIDISLISDNKLFLASGHLFFDDNNNFTNINNQFAISSPQIIDKFSNYYENYIKLLELIKTNKISNEYSYFNKIIVLHTLLFKFYICEYLKLPLIISDYKIKLLRQNGDKISFPNNSFKVYLDMKKVMITTKLLKTIYKEL
jgi:hypothetical protein